MADKFIVTQQELKPIKSDLADLAENLDAHVGTTISKAHGINLITGPGPLDPESGGNDLSQYYDSNGDLVGSRQIKVVANGTTVYVPCTPTALEGQPTGTGAIDTGTAEENAALADPGPSNWVTSFVEQAESDVQSVSDLLIAHSGESLETVHGGIDILPKETLDSDGHLVGDRVVTIAIGGIKYEIPASSRIGGPEQGPRGVSLTPTQKTIDIDAGDSNNVDVPFTTVASGTAPLIYQYQVLQGVDWVDMTPGTSVSISYSGSGGNGSFRITWPSTSTGILRIVRISPGSNDSDSAYIRCVVTNSGGSVTSNECRLVLKDDS